MQRRICTGDQPAALSYLAGLPPLPADAQYHRWEWDFPGTAPETLWPLVCNTDRFNYDSGLPQETNIGDERSLGIPRQQMVASARGFTVAITQRPFEWVEPCWYGVYRHFATGPLALFRNVVELLGEDGGTRVVYHSWYATRGTLGRLLFGIHLRTAVAPGLDRAFRKYGSLAAARPQRARTALSGVTAQTPAQLAPGGAERLAAGKSVLERGPDDPALISRLVELLERGDGFVVSRIRPYELAMLWDFPRRAVLELCLRATRAGLLDLRWDLLCPLCRGAKQTADTLSDINREVHCGACNIDYEVNFERQVELSFRTNSAVRAAPDQLYCAGAPGLTPHIAVQLLLAPGEQRTVEPLLPAGRYRLRLDNSRGGRYLRIEPGQTGAGAAQLVQALDPAAWPEDEPALAATPQLTLHNVTDRPQLAILERLAWADDAVTAAEVTSLQLFRDLFSREALRPGQEISVGHVAVLFTDLVASTRLYREIGDAPAFGRVMQHFDVLREELDRAGGAIVKTIGDAILGIATSPLPMLRAMLAAQARLAASDPPLLLKAGLHNGPCIAVNLNDRLDYFGTTVNFAARLAHAAHGQEIVLSDEVRHDPEVAEWLAQQEAALSVEPLRAELKGFEEESAQLWHVRPGIATLHQPASADCAGCSLQTPCR
jgi:class 3 adenylate cyclase